MALHAPCPCCLFETSALIVLTSLAVLYYILSYLTRRFMHGKSRNLILGIMTTIATIIVAIIAIFLGTLASSKELRARFFAFFCNNLTKSTTLDEITCNLLKHVHGRVLEVGPGPGANFRCFEKNDNIIEWVGVEPNEYFKDYLNAEKNKRNITFPTKVVWLNGENLDIDPQSFDSVVGTHVLCSVHDVKQVLVQINRALKPGGTYYFLEHVISESNDNKLFFFYQKFFEPVINIIANGCKFLPLGEYIQDPEFGLQGYNISIRTFTAPTGLSFLRPHVSGYAVKLK